MPATTNHEQSADGRRDAARLRYGGVYQSEGDGGSCDYLRFYADGTVLETSARAGPAEVAQWLKRDYTGLKQVSRGHYLVRKNHVSLSSRFGVECEGHIHGLTLELDSYNHINGVRAFMTYQYVDLHP